MDKMKNKIIVRNFLIPLVVAIIAGVVIILIQHLFSEEAVKDVIIKNSPKSVVSFNQEGGITAHTININSSKISFNEQYVNKLAAYLPSDKEKAVIICAIQGNDEAIRYAYKMKLFFESKGWIIDGVHQRIYADEFVGINLYKHKDGTVELIVGRFDE